MSLYFTLLVALFVCGIAGKPRRSTMPVPDFMARELTCSINGFFILLIALSHMRSYIRKAFYVALDQPHLLLIRCLGQLVVAPFLFYSGYGIMESIKHKEGYAAGLPRRRVLPFLVDVWISLAFYLALALYRGKRVTLTTLAYTLVGLRSIGNSNWYVFAIVCLWMATYLAFLLFPHERQRPVAVAVVTALTLAYALWFWSAGYESRWFNTAFCYPAGMAFSLGIDRVRSLHLETPEKTRTWAACVAGGLTLCVILRLASKGNPFVFNLLAIVFMLVVTLFQMRIHTVSRFFYWAGEHLFPLFLYQRIPMILLAPLAARNTILYEGCSLCAALLFAAVMPHVHARIKGLAKACHADAEKA